MISLVTLKKNKDFSYVYRRGRALHSKDLTLVHVKSRYGFRAGFSVSKKVGNSVVRNKVRRRLKEAFRRVAPVNAQPCSMVFIAKPGIVLLSFEELQMQMRGLFRRAGLYENDST